VRHAIIELDADFSLESAETFHSLAEASEAHSVDFQDYYGITKPGGRPWLGDFEARVAADLGKEAGLFLPSGTMAQLIVLCCAQKTKIGEENIHGLYIIINCNEYQ